MYIAWFILIDITVCTKHQKWHKSGKNSKHASFSIQKTNESKTKPSAGARSWPA